MKKKYKITTLTTIKKLLFTPLNTELLPKKMDLNFIFKICIFSKIRCGERTKSFLSLQRLKPKKKLKKRKVLNLKVFKCFITIQDIQTLIWGMWALQFSKKGKRYVVSLKPFLLDSTILVNLQAAWKKCNVSDQWQIRLKLLEIV